MSAANDRTRRSREADKTGEEGIALFVVLVVVIILSVVISELTLTTKVEERVAEFRFGETEIQYSFQSAARVVMSRLYDDALVDSEAGVEGAGDSPDEDDEARANAGTGIGGLTGINETSAGTTQTLDSRHEEWRREVTEQLNDVEVKIRVIDGESAFDVNRLFDYVQVEGEDMGDEVDGTSDDLPPELQSAVSDAMDGDAVEEPFVDEEEENPLPSPERVDRTIEFVERLIESLIQRNQEWGFYYVDVPNPIAVADDLVRFLYDRREDDTLGPVWNLETLLRLETMTWELLYGPKPPPIDEELEDEEEEIEDPLAGGRRSSRADLEAFSEFGIGLDEFGPQGAPLEGYEEIEEGLFVEIPRPLGLVDVLTTHSTGKLNLNTARPEAIYALLLDMDPDVAWEMVLVLDDHLNSYPEEDEDAADLPVPDEEDAALAAGSTAFNVFRQFDDLLVDETWDERDVAAEKSPFDTLRETLEPICSYNSTFFVARLEGKREEQQLQGELVIARHDGKIRVLVWRDLSR